ncbi:acyl-CoA dehydrogenase-related protein [Dorcoceras hygrometricum]|uniref:Acyl-CoA dehydrogenase-related protein n=1 Tax=Dorcoceras hygrometricum TaxID=472368 RepID=A0A2Z7D7K9_9LAMI|nr:acyl-CoA dehydrogenase-related protein [Dorcoceras hygrometricum]
MSLFNLQDVCIAIGSLATLDLPMVIDLIGIYVLKGPYCTLTTTNWFLQTLSVIPRGSWGDVARRFTMIRWANNNVLKDPSLGSDTTVGIAVADPDPTSRGAAEKQKFARKVFNTFKEIYKHTQGAAVDRQSGPRPNSIFLQSACTRKLMDFARTETPLHDGRNKSGEGRCVERRGEFPCGKQESGNCVTLNGSGIQLAVGPQPLWLRNHNFGLAQRIMVKRLATSRHDPLGITDSACKNQLVVFSVQYGHFNTYIPIRSTTIGKSRVARDPIAMHTSWRSNSDIVSVTSIRYPRMRASGESSTTKHRLLHASGSHPIPPPNDPKVSMTFRVVRTNQYNQDLGLIHSTNGNHLKSPNEGSSIDH